MALEKIGPMLIMLSRMQIYILNCQNNNVIHYYRYKFIKQSTKTSKSIVITKNRIEYVQIIFSPCGDKGNQGYFGIGGCCCRRYISDLLASCADFGYSEKFRLYISSQKLRGYNH